MVRTRYCTSAWWPIRLHAILCQGFFEINEDMVQILPMLEVLFTQDSKVEDLFCGASSGSEPSLFFNNYFSAWGLSLFKMTFSMTLL